MNTGDPVVVKKNGHEYFAVVVGFLPCGHVVVSVDGKSIAVPPKEIFYLGVGK